MKLAVYYSGLFSPLIFTAVATMFLNGCAETPSNNTKSLLIAAGFRVRTPDTPRKKEVYDSLPDSHIERAKVNGKVFYVFKDAKAGVAYVGHEAEYQRYRQLCIQHQMNQNLYMSEDMSRIQSHRFYGEWGASVVWR